MNRVWRLAIILTFQTFSNSRCSARQKDQHQSNPRLLLLGFCLHFAFFICDSVSLLLFLAARRRHKCRNVLMIRVLAICFPVIAMSPCPLKGDLLGFVHPLALHLSSLLPNLPVLLVVPFRSRFVGTRCPFDWLQTRLQIQRRTSVSSAQQPPPKYHFIALWISTNWAQ